MPKFSLARRELIKSLVANYIVLRYDDNEIQQHLNARLKEEPDLYQDMACDTISIYTIRNIRQSLKRKAAKWFKRLMSDRYEYISIIKERQDTFTYCIYELFKLYESELDNMNKNKIMSNIIKCNENLTSLNYDYQSLGTYLGNASVYSTQNINNKARSGNGDITKSGNGNGNGNGDSKQDNKGPIHGLTVQPQSITTSKDTQTQTNPPPM